MFYNMNDIMATNSALREISSIPKVPQGTDSGTQFEILKMYIEEFQKTLDAEHEVGMLLTNFGRNILLRVTFVSYESPAIMIFKGYADGREATLMQHVSQLNFMLTSIPKEPDRPKRTIGFAPSEE